MRQTNVSRTYKVGYTARDFTCIDWVTLFGLTANPTGSYVMETGVPGVDFVNDTPYISFAANVDAPIAKGMLSPQVVVLPAKDVVNVKASIIWDTTTGVAGEKVGWILYVQHTLIGDTLYGVLTDGFKQSAISSEVDYTYSLIPALDPLWAYPRTQYAVGYGDATANELRKTPMYHLKYDTASTLKLDDTFALRDTSEYIDDTYCLLTMYIYRMAGADAGGILPTFLADGLYDADGCGSPDTDNFAGVADFYGILLEFD